MEVDFAGFLRLPEILQLIPISRSSWWRGIREGRFPPGIKLTPRTTAWLKSEILSLMEKLIEESSNEEKLR